MLFWMLWLELLQTSYDQEGDKYEGEANEDERTKQWKEMGTS